MKSNTFNKTIQIVCLSASIIFSYFYSTKLIFYTRDYHALELVYPGIYILCLSLIDFFLLASVKEIAIEEKTLILFMLPGLFAFGLIAINHSHGSTKAAIFFTLSHVIIFINIIIRIIICFVKNNPITKKISKKTCYICSLVILLFLIVFSIGSNNNFYFNDDIDKFLNEENVSEDVKETALYLFPANDELNKPKNISYKYFRETLFYDSIIINEAYELKLEYSDSEYDRFKAEYMESNNTKFNCKINVWGKKYMSCRTHSTDSMVNCVRFDDKNKCAYFMVLYIENLKEFYNIDSAISYSTYLRENINF